MGGVALAETVHGVLREPAPCASRGAPASCGPDGRNPFGSLIILGVAWLFIRWIGAGRKAQLLGVGGLWLVLMLVEIGLGRALGISWDGILPRMTNSGRSDADWNGRAVFAPLLAARLRQVGWHSR